MEIVEFKKLNAGAFISTPVNPAILIERIFNLFNIPLPPVKKTMPMLMDIHARGNIIVAQIEGNLEPEKLELFNYYLRSFCMQKGLTSPRVLLILPSLYPESMSEENVNHLFQFAKYPEFKIADHYVKILTAIPRLISLLKMNIDLAKYEIAPDYLSALQTLQIDFDKRKTVPVEFIKIGSIYIFDLYDNGGRRVIPAHTPVTDKMMEFIAASNYASLSYFSDFDLDEIERDALEFDSLTDAERALDILSSAYEPVMAEVANVDMWDERLTLFFRNCKGQHALIVTQDVEVSETLSRSLDVYFKIDRMENGGEFFASLKDKQYVLIFLDSKMGNDRILDALRQIRSTATRRKTSVIILADQINKVDVLRYKDSGTDNIIVSPFTASKLLNKEYESVDADRRN
jgi:CheY-like chemotaxis protein